ncbi:MAG: alpha-L-fucosidase [Chitinophagaceae bacterium]|nr:alpha-L-fucosidase [Chitinophagaceae bacterium]
MAIRLLLIITAFSVFLAGHAQKRTAYTVLPSKSHLEWAEAEIGVIIHLDINIYAPETFDYRNKATLPDLSVFNPSRLNTDQWLEAAGKAGAKYAVLVAKHGTGFTLWPSKANSYHVGNTPWKNGKGDIVADFIQSCKKYNIKPGFYYNTNANTFYGAGYNPFESSEKQKEYNEIVLSQLTELWTGYGKLMEIWFDGGIMVDEKGGIAGRVAKLIRDYQPEAILFQGPPASENLIRWVGNEDGRAPYPHWSRADASTASDGVAQVTNLNGSPNGRLWVPGEADFPNRKKSAWNGGWLWRANEEQHIFSPAELVDRYYTSVGRNANMLIGMVIDTAGRFPDEDYKAFVAFGEEIKRRFSEPVAVSAGEGNIITLKLPSPALINQIEIMEDITQGERIRKYVVEAFVNNAWRPLCDGTSVGHKRIQVFDTVQTSGIRVKVTNADKKPLIKRVAVFNVK